RSALTEQCRAQRSQAGGSARDRDRSRIRGPQRSRYAAQRSALGGGAGEAGGEAPGLCAAGGQEHAEPTGVVACRAADALSQDWPRAGGDRTVVRGAVLGGAWTSAAADRAGSGCDG